MRFLLTAGLLLVAASTLGAQQDSTARRDSILERERRRIHGEAQAVEVTRDFVVRPRHRSVAASLGLVGSGDWLKVGGGTGLTMTTRPGARLGVEGAWPTFRRADVVAVARVSLATAGAKERDLAGDSHTVMTADLLGGIDWLVATRVRLRAAAGGAWVHGPSDLEPWADDGAFAPAADLAAALRLTNDDRWRLAFGVTMLRYSGMQQGVEKSGALPGTVTRPWLEVRRAF